MADATPQRPARTFLIIGIVLVAIGALFVVLVVPFGNSGTDGNDVVVPGHPLLGKPAPEIDLVSLDGERVVLSALKGSPVLLNFWATWCIPCREEFPLMVDAYAEHSDEGLQILGVVHDDTADGARRFATDLGATWPMLLDGDDIAWNDYVGMGLPTSFFIDREGIVRAFSLGGFTKTGLPTQLDLILTDGEADRA